MNDLEKLLRKGLQKNKRGVYLLIIVLHNDTDIKVGKLCTERFKRGIYFYVGSAKNGFNRRVPRYFAKVRKKKWHIDYLLEKGESVGIFFMENYFNEDKFAEALALMGYKAPIKRFGSTDTKAFSHLFFKEFPV